MEHWQLIKQVTRFETTSFYLTIEVEKEDKWTWKYQITLQKKGSNWVDSIAACNDIPTMDDAMLICTDFIKANFILIDPEEE